MMLPSTPHNGISIVILTLVIVVIIWAFAIRSKTRTRGKKMIFYFGIGFLIIGFFLIISQLDLHKEVTPTITTPIVPTVTKPPKIPTFIDMSKTNPEQIIFVTLGSVNSGHSLSTLEKEKKTAFQFNDMKIDMYVMGGRLYIDADVSDGFSEYVVQIRGYSFLVNPENWDKNFDNNAFEVVNQDWKPVFQLILESQYNIIIYGIFPIPGGGVVWANEAGLFLNPSQFETFNLDPIFKYPSSQFQGQRIMP